MNTTTANPADTSRAALAARIESNRKAAAEKAAAEARKAAEGAGRPDPEVECGIEGEGTENEMLVLVVRVPVTVKTNEKGTYATLANVGPFYKTKGTYIGETMQVNLNVGIRIPK